MDLASIIGIVVCVGGFIGGFILEGGKPLQELILPGGSAALIVLGGTFGAAMVSMPLKTTIGLPKITAKAFFRPSYDLGPIIAKFVSYAEKVRREGLLVLEEDASQEDDEFLKNGLQLVIDGNDTDLVKDILATELRYLASRHHQGAHFFVHLGGFAPTFGIIGTVMGLVVVLKGLGGDINELGAKVALAFLATLYGVVSANAFFLPIGNKLAEASHEEQLMREIMIEGILSIQAGDNPRIVKEKLAAFLPPNLRAGISEEEEE
jgi:chemotaxis protein MotA